MIRIKRNPTDYDILNKISITKKKYEDGNIEYLAYVKDKLIGGIGFNIYKGYVIWVQIEPSFRRKGIASYLYDHVEKDLNIKLKPSPYLLNDGEKFWKNRSKKQNPTDKEFLSKVKIKKVLNKEYISYEAFYNNRYIAGVDFDPKTKTVWDVWVGPSYRRKGLATFIYNKIERDQKIKLKPSETLFPDGQEFWKARLKTG